MRAWSTPPSLRQLSGLFVMVVACARADTLYLSPIGQQNLDVLRSRIAPAPLFEDAQRKQPYVRGIIVGELPARIPTARYDTEDGRPSLEIVAFDATGDRRSATVAINSLWVSRVDIDYDSDLDVRMLFSDRDRLARVPLGSRVYFAMARRAADPEGRLGLWRGDLALPPEPAGVDEGQVVRFLLDPPVFDASGRADRWAERRRAATMERAKKLIAERRLGYHSADVDGRPSLMVPKLLDAVARERTYRLSRSGFDRTALAMLVFLLDLATVPRTESRTGENQVDMIHDEGLRSVLAAVQAIGAASPTSPGHRDPPELVELMHRYRAATTEAERASLAAEYDALQARVAPPGQTACLFHPQFCVDSSETAAAAIDALSASDGVYVRSNHWNHLAQSLVSLHSTPVGPNPHKHDRVDLRGSAFQLLVQLANPAPSPIPAREQLRQEGAREMRSVLYRLLNDDKRNDEEVDIARRALTAAAWGSAAELDAFVKEMLDYSLNDAEGIVREGPRATGGFRRPRLVRQLAHLRHIAALAASEAGHERSAAQRILDRVQKLRDERRERAISGRSAPAHEIFLQTWDELGNR